MIDEYDLTDEEFATLVKAYRLLRTPFGSDAAANAVNEAAHAKMPAAEATALMHSVVEAAT